jgi:ribosomal small subunit protein bTHX
MGKGDRRTRRGKLFRGTHGKRRLQHVEKTGTKSAAKPAAKVKAPAS